LRKESDDIVEAARCKLVAESDAEVREVQAKIDA
jgi:hypothetical protein